MIALALLILILSVATIFIPILGGYLTIIPGIFTLFLPGGYHIVALLISGLNIANILFMSPLLLTNAALGMQNHDGKWALVYVGIAIFHGLVALFIHFKYLRLRKKEGRDTKNIVTYKKSRAHKSTAPDEILPGFSLDDPESVLVTPVDLPPEPEVKPRPKVKLNTDKPVKQV
ncbi:MAG: hypothetical protein HQL74_03060 [Magnetococcales bacterium]|nr:hypothetical protein [Magnetococcales bacterium]